MRNHKNSSCTKTLPQKRKRKAKAPSLALRPYFDIEIAKGRLAPAAESSAATTKTATAPATAATAATAAASRRTSTACAVRLLAGLVLGLGRIVDEQGVEGQAVGQDKVADGAAAQVHGVEGDGVLALGGHLDVAQGSVHLRRDGSDGAVNDGAVLQLNGHRLIGAFHQEPNELHDGDVNPGGVSCRAR